MLPVTHGIPYTRRRILLYTVLLLLCTLLPVLIGMSGLIYLAAALVLGARFLNLALALQPGDRPDLPIQTFRYSITYLRCLHRRSLLRVALVGMRWRHLTRGSAFHPLGGWDCRNPRVNLEVEGPSHCPYIRRRSHE